MCRISSSMGQTEVCQTDQGPASPVELQYIRGQSHVEDLVTVHHMKLHQMTGTPRRGSDAAPTSRRCGTEHGVCYHGSVAGCLVADCYHQERWQILLDHPSHLCISFCSFAEQHCPPYSLVQTDCHTLSPTFSTQNDRNSQLCQWMQMAIEFIQICTPPLFDTFNGSMIDSYPIGHCIGNVCNNCLPAVLIIEVVKVGVCEGKFIHWITDV